MLGIGFVAVFRSSNDLGTVAVLALGGIFLFLGLSGLIPSRMTVGGNSVEYDDFANEVVVGALRSDDAETREAVARQVVETAEGLGEDIRDEEHAKTRRLLWQAQVELHAERTLTAVRRNLPTDCIEFEGRNMMRNRELVYGAPSSAPAGQVLVTVMWGDLRKAWLHNYVRSASRSKYGAYVFVGKGSDLPIVASVTPAVLFAVSWEGGNDDKSLARVLAEAHRVASMKQPPMAEFFAEGRTDG